MQSNERGKSGVRGYSPNSLAYKGRAEDMKSTKKMERKSHGGRFYFSIRNKEEYTQEAQKVVNSLEDQR